MNKDVCKLCYRRHGWKWNIATDISWKHRIVHCPQQVDAIGRSGFMWSGLKDVSEIEPPKECNAILEHLVMGQKRGFLHHLRKCLPWWAPGSLRK